MRVPHVFAVAKVLPRTPLRRGRLGGAVHAFLSPCEHVCALSLPADSFTGLYFTQADDQVMNKWAGRAAHGEGGRLWPASTGARAGRSPGGEVVLCWKLMDKTSPTASSWGLPSGLDPSLVVTHRTAEVSQRVPTIA